MKVLDLMFSNSRCFSTGGFVSNFNDWGGYPQKIAKLYTIFDYDFKSYSYVYMDNFFFSIKEFSDNCFAEKTLKFQRLFDSARTLENGSSYHAFF